MDASPSPASDARLDVQRSHSTSDGPHPGDTCDEAALACFDGAPIAAAICAGDGRIRVANESLRDLAGSDLIAEEATLDELLGTDAALRRLLDDASRGGLDADLMTAAGSRVPCRAHARALTNGLDLYVVQFENRSDVAARIEGLERLAYADDLTGLLNRRGFEAAARRLLAIARRDRRSLAVLFVDVDDLKSINDKHGHRAGDLAIAEAGRLLSSMFRAADAIGRYGGDEFCVLALTNGPASVHHLVARLERAVDEHITADPRFTLHLTVGSAHIGDPDNVSVTDMITGADRAMYAKRRARADAGQE